MASQHHLPVIQPESKFPRRRVLLMGAVAAGVVACRADADIGPGVMPPNPDDDGGGNQPPPGNDSGNQQPGQDSSVNNPGPDASFPGQDAMVQTPMDGSVVHPADVYTPPGQDAAQAGPDAPPPPPADAYVPPADTYVPPQCTNGPGSMVGTVSQFAMGTWTELQSPTIIIGHDANGLYAYSSVCTHQGCICDPPDSSGSSTCQCHGSVFDGNGAVVQGPARRALPHYALGCCNGNVYVNTSMTVAATVRTPPA